MAYKYLLTIFLLMKHIRSQNDNAVIFDSTLSDGTVTIPLYDTVVNIFHVILAHT